MTNTNTVHISRHPIVAAKLSELRDAKQNSKTVRELTKDLSLLLGYEASQNLETSSNGESSTANGSYRSVQIKDKVVLVPVLRSGLGFVDGFLNLFPEAPVYHLGIFREKKSLQAVEYYNKLPNCVGVDTCFVLDPVIATGNTAIATITILKESGLLPHQIKFVALVGSEQGIQQLQNEHPDVHIYLAAVDESLDSNSKSRNALAYLEKNKDEYEYHLEKILYQKDSITEDQLNDLVTYLSGSKTTDSSQWKVLLRPDAQKLVSSKEEAIKLIMEKPEHLERPFVVDFENKKAALGRPDLTDVETLVAGAKIL
ncbi:uracil phosphoribosyltransferase-domain-containing protein [Parasitella parasitica]|nr:uracil phosphoribosyltransferase-domain-containing protein [Parasitella parasitica]